MVVPTLAGRASQHFSTGQIRKNQFKANIKAGVQQIGLWTGLRNTQIAEMLTYAGYDWIVVDMEHSPNMLSDVLLQLQVAQPGNAEPMVRVPWNEPVIVKQVLDLGCQTILFPLVNSKKEAEAAVAATRYPPHGIRGVMSLARMNAYGKTADYYHKAADELCVVVQAETIEAVNAIPEIASVDGVDAVFIGPSDLSASMGYLGQSSHPEVHAAIKRAIQACKDNNIPAGFLSGNEDDAKMAIDAGATFTAIGSDMSILTKNATALCAKFKQHVASK
eukprot:CAMPEP_0175149584 /NCGR_PEP_ID=MMETSP0087-20121206/17330_1 /TAXON_ID=136419 /ORGANISM="Unknown Unknown, Strain D1" /LENGTH=275 /DNA_ID=CAMNT_0016435303 /DNA_START=85 /DNA_END=912 /DNA_ORIENTATION=-